MEVGLFSPRANVPVQGGPANLDSWCVVGSDPSGVLVKAAGTVAVHVGGSSAWMNVDGTAAGWRPLPGFTAAQLAALAALATDPVYSRLLSLGQSRVVYDAAFNAASVSVAGLSSAKRYRVDVVLVDNGATEDIVMQPDGLADGTSVSVGGAGALATARADIGLQYSGDTLLVIGVVVQPRRLGVSRYSGASHCPAQEHNTKEFLSGSMAVDFTALQFVFSATTRAGWLTVIEENP